MIDIKGTKVFLDSQVIVSKKDLEQWKIEGITGIKSLTHGIDHIDVLAAKKIGITVENSPGINAASVSEWALFKLLEWARKGKEFGIELSGKKAVIIGQGNIGTRIKKYLLALNLYVTAWDIAFIGADKDTLKILLRNANIVFLCIPYNKKNHKFFDLEKINWMDRGVVLINIGRAGLVDESALTKHVRYIHDENHVAWKTIEVLQRKKEIIKNARK